MIDRSIPSDRAALGGVEVISDRAKILRSRSSPSR